jgi:hypothetical protein
MDYFQLFDLKYYSWSQRAAIKGLMVLLPMSYSCLYLSWNSFTGADLISRLMLAAAVDTGLILTSIIFALFFEIVNPTKNRGNFLQRVLGPCFMSTIFFCYLIIEDYEARSAFNRSVLVFVFMHATFIGMAWIGRIHEKRESTNNAQDETEDESTNN